ncbi:MAG: DUF5690 family protein [Puniceicoccales bacterium]|nr:DUF5690 family protein [Puniceicoccales bacterium]
MQSTTGTALAFAIYAGLMAFVVYSCMYGFRKPFAAADYAAWDFGDFSYKVLAVCAQAGGYLCSKFLGIRVIAGLRPERRLRLILTLTASGWVALLFFAIVPAPYNLVFMFLNGLPLGLIWGIVFSYIEGRMSTEIMGMLLGTSFVLASGVTKFAGKILMTDFGISEAWMPFVAGAIFFLPLAICAILLNAVPAPSAEEVRVRHARLPMDKKNRRDFLRIFGAAILPAVCAQMLLVILREVRDCFANEIWVETGYSHTPDVFALSEIGVTLALLVMSVAIFSVKMKNTHRAFSIAHWMVIAGFALTAIMTWFFMNNWLSPFAWIVASGVALYAAYLLLICVYFERFLTAFHVRANVGFLVYLGDSGGYLAAAGVIVAKAFFLFSYGWTDFLKISCILIGIVGAGLMSLSLWLFRGLYQSQGSKSS